MPEQFSFDFDPPPVRLRIDFEAAVGGCVLEAGVQMRPPDPPDDFPPGAAEFAWGQFLRELVDILREALAALREAGVLRPLRRYA
jgi:hypothetical protein